MSLTLWRPWTLRTGRRCALTDWRTLADAAEALAEHELAAIAADPGPAVAGGRVLRDPTG